MKIVQNSLLLLLLLAFALAGPMESSELEGPRSSVTCDIIEFKKTKQSSDIKTGTEDETTRIDNYKFYDLVSFIKCLKKKEKKSRNSLLTYLVGTKAFSHVLGEVFIWFTTKGYTFKDEELYKTPIRSSDENQAKIIGNLIINVEFEKIFDYLPSDGYEYKVGRSLYTKYPSPQRQIYTHPVIFDYFLNYYGVLFIQKFLTKDVHFNEKLLYMANFRIDLLEILIDFNSNLDSTNELKVQLESSFLEYRYSFMKSSVRNGNVKLSKFFHGFFKESELLFIIIRIEEVFKRRVIGDEYDQYFHEHQIEKAEIEIAEFLHSKHLLYGNWFVFNELNFRGNEKVVYWLYEHGYGDKPYWA